MKNKLKPYFSYIKYKLNETFKTKSYINNLIDENEKLRNKLELFMDIKDYKIDANTTKLDLNISTDMVSIIAGYLAQWFEDNGGINYVELKMNDPRKNGIGPFLLTMQRRYGETPHNLRVKAELELSNLKLELEQLKNELNSYKTSIDKLV